jgi:hypothetical protein
MPKFRSLLFVLLMFAPLVPERAITATPLPTPKHKDNTKPAEPIGAKLPLRAALILTPDFCATKWTTGNGWTSNKEAYTVGQDACQFLEPSLKNSFSTLTRLEAVPSSGDAQVILQPKILKGDATKGRKREMVVLLEWTVTDTAGKTVWLQTVQGTATHKAGNAFTVGKNFKLLLAAAVQDAADESAREMSAAPELKSFAGNHAAQ